MHCDWDYVMSVNDFLAQFPSTKDPTKLSYDNKTCAHSFKMRNGKRRFFPYELTVVLVLVLVLVGKQFPKTNPPLPPFLCVCVAWWWFILPSSSFEIGRKITSIMFVWWSIMAKRPFALNMALALWMEFCETTNTFLSYAYGKTSAISHGKRDKILNGNFYRWKYWSKHMITHTIAMEVENRWLGRCLTRCVLFQKQTQCRTISHRWMLL